MKMKEVVIVGKLMVLFPLYLVTLLLCLPALIILDFHMWCMNTTLDILENKHV